MKLRNIVNLETFLIKERKFTKMHKFKEILGELLVLVILGAVFGASVSMYVDYYLTSEREPSERYVLEKQSEKGLFLGPRYQIITDRGGGLSFVTKKEFESLEIGDTIKGHSTNGHYFYTKMDDFYESSLLIFLVLTTGALFIICLVGFIVSIPWIEKKLTEQNKPKQKKKKKKKKIEFWMLLLGGIIAIGLVYNTLYTVNLLHKLMPIGQTTVEAEIVDRESDINITSKGNYSTHFLTVVFKAEDGQTYRVKKEITGSTYNQWQDHSTIDIRYRNHNPYNIFVKTKSVLEVISVLLHRWTIIYILVLFIIFGTATYCWENRRRRRKKGK